MKNILIIVKIGFCSFLSVFLVDSCRSVPKKIVPRKHTVEIKAMKFHPAEVVVENGDTVVWVNRDIVAHDVTEQPGKAWTSSVMPVGTSWSLVVTQSADYYCSIHVVMKGKLVVQ
jgi:plastocyanin